MTANQPVISQMDEKEGTRYSQGDSPTTLVYQSSCLLTQVVLPAWDRWTGDSAMRKNAVKREMGDRQVISVPRINDGMKMEGVRTLGDGVLKAWGAWIWRVGSSQLPQRRRRKSCPTQPSVLAAVSWLRFLEAFEVATPIDAGVWLKGAIAGRCATQCVYRSRLCLDPFSVPTLE